MNLKEKKLSSKTLYSGKIISLNLDEVELPNGKKLIVSTSGIAEEQAFCLSITEKFCL